MICGQGDIDIQVGGNATTGRGLVTMRFLPAQNRENTDED